MQQEPQYYDSPHTAIDVYETSPKVNFSDSASSDESDYDRIQTMAWRLLAANVIFVMLPSTFLGAVVYCGIFLLMGVQLLSVALSITFRIITKPVPTSSSFYHSHFYLAVINAIVTICGVIVQVSGGLGSQVKDDLLWGSLITLGIVVPILSAIQLMSFTYAFWHLRNVLAEEQGREEVFSKRSTMTSLDSKMRSQALSL
jgi:hypothetical protein